MSKIVRKSVGILYLLATLTIAGYLFYTEGTRGFVGLLSAAILLLFPCVRRVFRVPAGALLESLWLVFFFFAYTLGTGLALYARISYYDLILHTLSGVLTAMTGLCLYERVRPAEQRQRPTERGLATLTAFLFSQTVAMLWELAEYAGFLLTGHDSQNVAATGVGDTMEDMFVALVGSALICLLFLFQQTGHSVRLLRPVDEWRAAFRAYSAAQSADAEDAKERNDG